MKRKSAKILSVILSIVLVFSFASVTVFAAEGDGVTISTAAELSAFSKAVADGDDFAGITVSLTADISVDADFLPIGTKDTPFAGVFEGNGHEISDLAPDCNYAGLFAFTDGAEISDLTVTGEVFAFNYAGGIVAYAVDTVIENCVGNACVYADNYTGGIAGYMASGKIIDCSTTSDPAIIGYEAYTGGILGAGKADIIRCTNNAYIEGIKNTGGIAGSSSGNISYCLNAFSLEASGVNCGGIAGYTNGSVSYSRNKSAVTGSGKTGGIAGVASDAVIKECLNEGAVNANGNYTGGIAGYVTGGKISDCLSKAKVTNSADFVAGIFGYCSAATVERCLFTASVTSRTSTGAAIGAVANGNIADCYYNSASGAKAFVTGTSKTGATGISASDIAKASSYANWDFNNVWAINEIHAAHPLLKNVGYHALTVTDTVEATCTSDGYTKEFCTLCHETITTVFPASGHDYRIVSVKYASCTEAGYTDKVCNICSFAVSEDAPILPHADENADEICDNCGKDLKVKQPTEKKSFFQKIIDFFAGIFDWLKNLFN